MAGIRELDQLLQSLQPDLVEGEFVFCSLDAKVGDVLHLQPVALFKEAEGLSLIIPLAEAVRHAIRYEAVFRQISLSVHSSLEAVGLTAAVAEKLAAAGISANVVAAYYHDHIFVPASDAEQALKVLQQ